MKMMGSFLSRALIMIFGYAYPAYQCFKAAEKSNPEIEQLLYWCQYWNVVAMLTICERLGDNLISWLPMYSEAKLAFFIYLWHPKTRGTLYVYECFLLPFLKKHEAEIDNRLLELRVKGGEMALLYWEKAANYGYTKFFEILQYVSSPSVSGPHSTQQEPKAINDEIGVCEPISLRAAAEERQCKETNSNPKQQHERSTKSEKMPKKQSPAVENGNTEMCQQETFHKGSGETRHGRWRLFKNASTH